VIEAVHGDLSLNGWGRAEAKVVWEDDIHMRQEEGSLFLQIHGDGQLHVPHHLALVIVTVHGDLKAAGVPTTLELNRVYGDATIEHMGVLHTDTVDGDLRIQHITGPLVAKNVGGDLDVQQVAEEVNLTSVGGDARVHTVGAVSVTSIGGDLTLREVRGSVQIESVGGDLHTSHLHGDCNTSVAGDLKAGMVSGNLNCTVGGDAVLQRGDNQRVIERAGDLALARLVEPLEACFERLGFIAIEHLEANDLIGLAVAGHVEIAHRARDSLAHELISFLNVDLAAFEHRLEEIANSHGPVAFCKGTKTAYSVPIV